MMRLALPADLGYGYGLRIDPDSSTTMPTEIDTLSRLRDRCVQIHNLIDWPADRTLFLEVCESLGIPLEFEPQSAPHKLVSSYGFFSSNRLVAEHRHRFDDRFHDHADGRLRARLRDLRNSSFGAWEVSRFSSDADGTTVEATAIGRPDDDESTPCRLVGFDRQSPEKEAEVYAGWRVTQSEGRDLLIFATPIATEGAIELRQTADRDGWRVAGEFERTVYERDVLVAAAAPRQLEAGAERLWFVPPDRRRLFTARAFGSLMQRIYLEGLLGESRGDPWHLDLVYADQRDRLDEVRSTLEDLRRNAFRAAGRRLGVDVDLSQASHVCAISDILVALGAGPDGHIELGPDDRPGTQRRRADETHWLRLRWAALMSHFRDNRQHYDRTYGLRHLDPGYAELRRVLDELFDEVYGDLPIRELPHDPNGQLSRVAETLTGAGMTDDSTARLRDLPAGNLAKISGMGDKRVELVCENLWSLMTK